MNPFRKPLFLLSIGLLVSPLPTRATDAAGAPADHRLTLDAAIAEAIAQSPSAQVIAAEIEAARGEAKSARMRPNAELSFTPALKQLREGGETNHEFKGTIAYTRTIIFSGRQELLVAIADRNVELRQLGVEGLRFQLSTAVRRSFAELLTVQGIVGLRQQQLDSARVFQDAANQRLSAGYGSDFESVKAQGEVINARRKLQEAEGRIVVARVELNSLLGRDPASPLEVTGDIAVGPVEPVSNLIALAMSANPSLRVQALRAEIAGLNVRKAKTLRKSDYTWGPTLEYSKSEQILGVGFSVPLADKDYGQGEVASAAAEQHRVAAESDQLRREIAVGVAKAATQFDNARAQLALFPPDYLDRLKSVASQAEASYGASATSLFIYLDAKRTYFDALAEYQESLAAVASSRADLESAVGTSLP